MMLTMRSVRFLALPLLLAGAAAGMVPVTATAAAQTGFRTPRTPVPRLGQFDSVAATSAGNAWAVGYTPSGPLIERWNGKAWALVSTKEAAPAGSDFYGVAATSASNAWAVGDAPSYTAFYGSLIAHWNGKTWSQVHSPSPGQDGAMLFGVAATSASNAWAVGDTQDAMGITRTLVLHWNGKAWTRVASPSAGVYSQLVNVAASSASNAWAVGKTINAEGDLAQSLVLHWNGKAWTRVASPRPGEYSELLGVAASSAGTWAVGTYQDAAVPGLNTLILRWNGASWKEVSSPNPLDPKGSPLNTLQSVAVTSATNAWAIGYDGVPNEYSTTLILHWNGSAWKQVTSPNPYCAGCDLLYGVAATSARNAWAIGTVSEQEVMILHWNGSRWMASQPG